MRRKPQETVALEKYCLVHPRQGVWVKWNLTCVPASGPEGGNGLWVFEAGRWCQKPHPEDSGLVLRIYYTFALRDVNPDKMWRIDSRDMHFCLIALTLPFGLSSFVFSRVTQAYAMALHWPSSPLLSLALSLQ